MLSVYCNSCIKSWRNQRKRTEKNIKNKPLTKYNRDGINYPSEKYD